MNGKEINTNGRPDPIFILGSHKSGTSLLRSLFDGINDLYVIPIETHPFKLLDYWIRYPFRKHQPVSYDRGRFMRNAEDWIRKSNSNNDRLSDSVTINKFNESIFNSVLDRKLGNDDTLKNHINVYFEAIYSSAHNGRELEGDARFVEKSVDNSEFALDLNQAFPAAKFIHIIRNPYSNLVSLRKYKSTRQYPKLEKLIKTLEESYYFLYRNERLIKNYKVIKYEDLIENPRQTMHDISNFLSMEFNDKLLIPTYDGGKKWGGNSTSGKSFSGITKREPLTWQKEILDIEIFFINKNFSHIIERFNYSPIPIRKNFNLIKKAPKETLKTYFINRIYLKSV